MGCDPIPTRAKVFATFLFSRRSTGESIATTLFFASAFMLFGMFLIWESIWFAAAMIGCAVLGWLCGCVEES
jgi:hypothetical protein